MRANPIVGLFIMFIAVGTSCVNGILKPPPLWSERGVRFSHSLHLGAAGLTCLDCHSLAKDGGLYSIPRHDVCLGCHTAELASTSPLGSADTMSPLRLWLGAAPADPTCRQCHAKDLGTYEGAEIPPVSRYSSRTVDMAPITFSHTRHQAEQCEQCHPDILSSESARQDHLPTMASCMTCHNGKRASGDCVTCHPQLPHPWDSPSALAATTLPHPRGWVRSHGLGADGDPSCALCHEKSGCQSCHMETKPEDHRGATFAQSTHGRLALLDRDRCSTCHLERSCQQCHGVRPATHTLSFMDPLRVEGGDRGASLHRTMARHDPAACLTCHETTSCVSCHSGSAP